jgi:hypothetical protein
MDRIEDRGFGDWWDRAEGDDESFGGAGRNTLSRIGNLIGSAFNDSLTGDIGAAWGEVKELIQWEQ